MHPKCKFFNHLCVFCVIGTWNRLFPDPGDLAKPAALEHRQGPVAVERPQRDRCTRFGRGRSDIAQSYNGNISNQMSHCHTASFSEKLWPCPVVNNGRFTHTQTGFSPCGEKKFRELEIILRILYISELYLFFMLYFKVLVENGWEVQNRSPRVNLMFQEPVPGDHFFKYKSESSSMAMRYKSSPEVIPMRSSQSLCSSSGC